MCKLGIKLQCTLKVLFETVFDLTYKQLVDFFKKPNFNCQNKIFFNEFENKT